MASVIILLILYKVLGDNLVFLVGKMPELIQRKLMDDLMDSLSKRFISILIGPRQVGKTTLLKTRMVKAPKIYFFDQGMVNHTLRLTSIETLKSAQKLGTAMETLVLNSSESSLTKRPDA